MNFDNFFKMIENTQKDFFFITTSYCKDENVLPDSFYHKKKNYWLLEPRYACNVPQHKGFVFYLNQRHRKDFSHPGRYFRDLPDDDIIEIFIG